MLGDKSDLWRADGKFLSLRLPRHTGPGAPGPYAVCFYFVVGVALCAIPMNYVSMRRPLDGQPPITMADYRSARVSWHIWGVIGGSIWLTGSISNFWRPVHMSLDLPSHIQLGKVRR